MIFNQKRFYSAKPSGKFQYFIYKYSSRFWNVYKVCNAITQFLNSVVNEIRDGQYIQVLIRLKIIVELKPFYLSLTPLVNINKSLEEKINYMKLVQSLIDLKSNHYDSTYIDSLIFEYRIIDKGDGDPHTLSIVQDKINLEELRKRNKYSFSGYNLPLPNTLVFRLFGEIVNIVGDVYLIRGERGYTLQVIVTENFNIINIIADQGKTVMRIEDQPKGDKDMRTFQRRVNNDIYNFKNRELLVKEQVRKTSFIPSVEKSKKISEKKIFTLDIETRESFIIDEAKGKRKKILKPYLISIFDGKKSISFYLADYKDEMELVRKCIDYLIERSKHTRTVYVHNLSNFDSIFFLKYLAQVPDSKLKILMRDGRFIQIHLSNNEDKKNFSLTFRDSYQMLPNSLKALAKTFDVENKGTFPIFFS